MFPRLTYCPPGRRTAREMAEVVTPSCRATSANESPSLVTVSVAREFRGHHTYFGEMPRRQVPGTLIEGILPDRGLGSGIQRALEAWSRIELTEDRDGCLFTAAVRRTAEQETAAGRVTGEVTGEVTKLLQAIKKVPNTI